MGPYNVYPKNAITMKGFNQGPKPPVPQSNKRGCLCKDKVTYSTKCCDKGDMWAQGIGFIGGKGQE